METQISRQTMRSQTSSYGEVTYAQYKDLQGRVDHVEKELDRVNIRLDRVERKLENLDDKIDKLDAKIAELDKKVDAKIDKLGDKIDELRRDNKSSSNHGQIAEISTIGIALAVIYFVATH
ncbi:MAG: hypothetical protein IJ774_09545 [Selenomonadaceae bacterium]|nr:hypothetical protein [Selenomonadaceae bacterium]